MPVRRAADAGWTLPGKERRRHSPRPTIETTIYCFVGTGSSLAVARGLCERLDVGRPGLLGIPGLPGGLGLVGVPGHVEGQGRYRARGYRMRGNRIAIATDHFGTWWRSSRRHEDLWTRAG